VTGSWLADDCGSGGRLVFWVAVTLALTDDSGSDRLDAQSGFISLWLYLIRAFSLSRLAVVFSV